MPQKAQQHTPPKPRQDRRPSGHNRAYKNTAWQELRKVILTARPVCEVCRRESAVHVDHRKALAQGGTNDESNLVALCHSCHSKKTVAVDGGFGRQRKEKETR